jgi:peptide chain release factor 2
MISTSNNKDAARKWLQELAGVYASWSRHRGYQCRFFGEQHDGDQGDATIIAHLRGLNSFGLLKNERGIHRKTVIKRLKGQRSDLRKSHYDCNVCVLADVQPLEKKANSYDMIVDVIKPPLQGWKVKSLNRRVSLRDHNSEEKLLFYADDKIESDENLASELFLSYLHFRKREKQTNATGDAVWGSLVRAYESGEKSRIVDYRTKIVISNVKEYLSGKIDPLLLERLV